MKISACWIVKDEAEELRRSLASAASAADERIIVSTAGAPAVAAAAAAHHADLYNVVWQDDFSVARNEALRHATGDYVIFLDADEYFFHPEEVRAGIADTLRKEPDADVLMILLCSFLSAEDRTDAVYERSPRIFRRVGMHSCTARHQAMPSTLRTAILGKRTMRVPLRSRRRLCTAIIASSGMRAGSIIR